MSVRLIPPVFVERVWGTTQLEPLFPNQDKEIGEVWFDVGPTFPILIKFIFTSKKLSVQVHPGNEYAREHENSRGKTEMWHILAARPDSSIALGFLDSQSNAAVRAAIANNTVAELLNWVPVKAGDTFLAEAGTVHAIGEGITLCEIQQNSDVTYRLFDYGRDRPLHLEKGMAVANTGVYEGRRNYPVVCDYFHVDLLEITDTTACQAGCDGAIVVLEGEGSVGDLPIRAGQVVVIPPDEGPAMVSPKGRLKLLHATCSPGT